jgi:hypothetical protein
MPNFRLSTAVPVKSAHRLTARGTDEAVATIRMAIDAFVDSGTPLREFWPIAVGNLASPTLNCSAAGITLADAERNTVVGRGNLDFDARRPVVEIGRGWSSDAARRR